MMSHTIEIIKTALKADNSVSASDRARVLATIRHSGSQAPELARLPEPRLIRRAEVARCLGCSLRLVAARIPHKGEVLVDPGAASFQLTSNGIEATPDFAKRASITRMLKQRSGFAFKRYDEGNLRDHVAANQPRYLGAVFSLIRDWCRRNKPTTNTTGHDFREWAAILDSFTCYYMSEQLLSGHEQAQERTANPALSWLRAVGLLVLNSGKAGRELPAAELYEMSADVIGT